MPKLEIPDLPENLYQQIAEIARRKGVPLEQQAAEILARGVATDDADEAELLAEVRQAREALTGIFVTEAELQAAKRRGCE